MTWQITDLFVQFSLLNFVAFGGVTAMLPEIHRLVVEQRQWMDDATFAQLFAIAQAAPGPNLLFVSLIGWQVAGIGGGIAATLGICLPVSIFIFLLYQHWEKFRGTPWQQAIENDRASKTKAIFKKHTRLLENPLLAAGIKVKQDLLG